VYDDDSIYKLNRFLDGKPAKIHYRLFKDIMFIYTDIKTDSSYKIFRKTNCF